MTGFSLPENPPSVHEGQLQSIETTIETGELIQSCRGGEKVSRTYPQSHSKYNLNRIVDVKPGCS